MGATLSTASLVSSDGDGLARFHRDQAAAGYSPIDSSRRADSAAACLGMYGDWAYDDRQSRSSFR